MKHFEISLDGEEKYRKGQSEFLGSALGHQAPVRHISGRDELIIIFDGGAQMKIPNRRILRILEG